MGILTRVFKAWQPMPKTSVFNGWTAMMNAQNEWFRMYRNKSPWLTQTIKSLNLAANVSAEVAKMIALEIESSVSDDAVNEIYQSDVLRGLLEHIEHGLALGGVIYKPYIVDNFVRVDIVLPLNYQVLQSTTAGIITDIVFRDYVERMGEWYVRIERHTYNDMTKEYRIENRAFQSDLSGTVGDTEIELEYVDEWRGILPELELKDIEQPLFGHFKPAIANHIDLDSTEGVSIFSRAVELIEVADKQLSSTLREFRVKEAKQYVSSLAVRNPAEPLPHLQDDFYIKLNMSTGKGGAEDFFESYSPEIHVDAYITGLNEYKRLIEDCLGLAHGTISPPQAVTRTATEVRTSKHRTYELVTLNQKNVRSLLEGVVYALAVWVHYPAIPPEMDFFIEFDDSLLVDQAEELRLMKEDVAAGLLRPEIYVAKRYGVTEEIALTMMPSIQWMSGDNQSGAL